jgi:hypothetical protein
MLLNAPMLSSDPSASSLAAYILLVDCEICNKMFGIISVPWPGGTWFFNN